jgi:DNA-binding Lrp family transcriptional regulator
MAADIDQFDRRILAILQQDNRISQRDIAEKVNLSPAAVHRRIKRLEDDKIIGANVAVVVPAKVDRTITCVVEVSIEREHPDILDKLKAHLLNAPEVQQCYYVTGTTDFILIITALDMADYEKITKQLFFSQKNVKHFRTMVVMDTVKATLAVPV